MILVQPCQLGAGYLRKVFGGNIPFIAVQKDYTVTFPELLASDLLPQIAVLQHPLRGLGHLDPDISVLVDALAAYWSRVMGD